MAVRVRITERCFGDLTDIPDEVADDFESKLKLRAQAPENGERIQCLVQHPCFSIHSNRFRAATWFDRSHEVLWLIGVGIHLEDSPDDFYNVVRDLERSGNLYPTEEDYALLAEAEVIERRQQEVDNLADLRDEVLRTPDKARRVYRSPDGLYAEIWAEEIPQLRLVALRVHMFRTSRDPLTPENLAILVDTVLGSDAVECPDPDKHWAFRYFENYFTVADR